MKDTTIRVPPIPAPRGLREWLLMELAYSGAKIDAWVIHYRHWHELLAVLEKITQKEEGGK